MSKADLADLELSSSVETHSMRQNSTQSRRAKALVSVAVYLVCLSAAAVHLYRKPDYSMDSIQYMGNALLDGNLSIPEIHTRVYSEVERWIPEPTRGNLLGNETGAPADQNFSREMRAKDPRVFGEFLPFFAIRPMYNLTVRYLSKTGLGSPTFDPVDFCHRLFSSRRSIIRLDAEVRSCTVGRSNRVSDNA